MKAMHDATTNPWTLTVASGPGENGPELVLATLRLGVVTFLPLPAPSPPPPPPVAPPAVPKSQTAMTQLGERAWRAAANAMTGHTNIPNS